MPGVAAISTGPNTSTRFGRFELWHRRGTLTADGEPVQLSRRAFEILELLLERRGEIVAKADDSCKDPAHSGAAVTPYSFKVTQGDMGNAVPAFAIANSSRPLTVTEQGVTADLEGDGQREYFRSCTSAEGVHLTIWKGKPLEGVRKWHYYYYLGFDVTPDCTENEYKPDADR